MTDQIRLTIIKFTDMPSLPLQPEVTVTYKLVTVGGDNSYYCRYCRYSVDTV